ncbi:hypothetical protein [Hasllibacter sp. MH4015]|nr:hypothetical protein [Hasllibacter sp. MH4015]
MSPLDGMVRGLHRLAEIVEFIAGHSAQLRAFPCESQGGRVEYGDCTAI